MRDKIIFNKREFDQWYVQGLVPSIQAQAFFAEEKGLPMTTFQFLVKHGELPVPNERRGKYRFYDRATFDKLKMLWVIIRALKENSKIETLRLGKILKKHGHSDELVDLLLSMVRKYPLYEPSPEDAGDWSYRGAHSILWLRVLDELEGNAKPGDLDLKAMEKQVMEWSRKRIKAVLKKG